jgi:hypothetical protein
MANQEFHKTTSPTFGPSFEKLSATPKSKYSKHPRKMANQEFHKTTFPTFGPSFEYFCQIYKPQHNGLHVTTTLKTNKSIMVRSHTAEGGRLKSE